MAGGRLKDLTLSCVLTVRCEFINTECSCITYVKFAFLPRKSFAPVDVFYVYLYYR